MSKIINISEAASLALHSLALIARAPGRLNVNEIADEMKFSRNHLAKVLQILVRYNYLNSVRGPKGGFVLNKDADEITLLEIYEIFEGKISTQTCALHNNDVVCPFETCVFGGLTGRFSKEFEVYLRKRTIGSLIQCKIKNQQL